MRIYIVLTVMVFALFAVAMPALAADPITITNLNTSTITNTLSATSNSGSNIAHGASATSALVGGNVRASNYNNAAGNAGGTILGGMGGVIKTGNTEATVAVENRINTNKIDLQAEPWSVGIISLTNDNTVSLLNGLTASAASGANAGNGDTADSTIDGGNIADSGSSNTAGNSAGHVEAGGGGSISTGNSVTQTQALNVLNRNIVRIRR